MSTTSKSKKTLKDIEVPQINCGLSALSKLAEMKNVSAFTLIHLARDNGQSLHVFKVADNKDLIRVIRPAIFHQKDHFVYVGVDEPMPEGDYTGFVLGHTILGRVISLAEAKFVKGSKNFITGKNKDGVKEGGGALGTILGVVGAVVGSIIPGVGTIAGASLGGAIGGGVGSGITGDNIALGALGGAAAGFGIGGGIAGVTAGGGLKVGAGNVISNFGKGAFQAISHPISSFANGLNAGAAGIASGAAGAGSLYPGALASAYNSSVPGISAGYGAAGAGASNVGGWTSSMYAPTAGFGLSNISNLSLPSDLQGAVGAGASNAATGGGGFFNAIGKTVSDSYSNNPIGTIASGVGALGVFGSKAPAYSGASPIENYASTSQFLGPNALSQPTTDQLSKYITTPIEDLAKTFTGTSTRVKDAINQAYDNQKQGLVHQFAQAGQNTANSSELQDQISKLEQKRSSDLSNAELEVQNAGIGQAIQVKQQALSQGMQSGQFNQALAMQLATLTGDQQNLQYAIANNDYQSFQQIMGKLLTMGIPQSVTAAK